MAGEMAILGAYFNPCGFVSGKRNYLRWLKLMRSHGAPLYIAEVCYPGQPPVNPTAFLQLQATDRHVLWQRERLINLLCERIPDRFEYVAWVDTDAIFLAPDWYERTVQALQSAPVAQMFDTWHYTDKVGKIAYTRLGVGENGVRHLTPNGGGSATGGAWAARREVLPLYAGCPVGAGDTYATGGWMGIWAASPIRSHMTSAQCRDWDVWAKDAHRKVRGRIAMVEGDVVHMWHGDESGRQYTARHQILQRAEFDPARHLQTAANGLLEWSAEARAGMMQEVRDYFLGRKEDS